MEKLYLTAVLIHGQSDFFIQSIDPDSKTVRSYYPDLLFERDDGTMVIIEVKGNHLVNNPPSKRSGILPSKWPSPPA